MEYFIGRRNIGKLTYELSKIMLSSLYSNKGGDKMLQTTPFKEYCCKNCELSVHIGGHYICTKYGMSVDSNEDVCANIERRFTYADQNKTVVHNSEVVVKKF